LLLNNRAVEAAWPFLDAVEPKNPEKQPNGWWTPPGVGIFGTEYVLRAYMALNFIWPNVAGEAAYPMTSVDGEGWPLSWAHQYVMHFVTGNTPLVEAF